MTHFDSINISELRGSLSGYVKWDSSVVTVEGLRACVFVFDNGIWILRDSRLRGIPYVTWSYRRITQH